MYMGVYKRTNSRGAGGGRGPGGRHVRQLSHMVRLSVSGPTTCISYLYIDIIGSLYSTSTTIEFETCSLTRGLLVSFSERESEAARAQLRQEVGRSRS